MKKFLLILLTALIGLSCFACVEDEPPKRDVGSLLHLAYDTYIQDSEGVDTCFWEDGAVEFNDVYTTGRQNQKHAELSTQTEYDMWFCSYYGYVVDFTKYYYPIEFEYDETKIEIKANPNKENHFILKILQPCDKEVITFLITSKSPEDILLDRKEPSDSSLTQRLSITVSTTE